MNSMSPITRARDNLNIAAVAYAFWGFEGVGVIASNSIKIFASSMTERFACSMSTLMASDRAAWRCSASCIA